MQAVLTQRSACTRPARLWEACVRSPSLLHTCCSPSEVHWHARRVLRCSRVPSADQRHACGQDMQGRAGQHSCSAGLCRPVCPAVCSAHAGGRRRWRARWWPAETARLGVPSRPLAPWRLPSDSHGACRKAAGQTRARAWCPPLRRATWGTPAPTRRGPSARTQVRRPVLHLRFAPPSSLALATHRAGNARESWRWAALSPSACLARL